MRLRLLVVMFLALGPSGAVIRKERRTGYQEHIDHE